MRTVKTGQPIAVLPRDSHRAQAGRRVQAARLIADISLRDAARSAGLTVAHVAAIEAGHEPMTTTDARDLAAALGCHEDWLRHGRTDETP
jgi:transcriptional regulator with XRE-family HTH domain